jgi:hypothetical protein
MAEFFAGRRDWIGNPWPDNNAGAAAARYKACLDQIRELINSRWKGLFPPVTHP